MATLKLAAASSGYIFAVRHASPPTGTNVSTVGYPLGNNLSVNQGRIILKRRESGIPLIYLRLLGAEGASGSPLVDDAGRVVGILQIGLGFRDVLGQRTAGVIAGIDLASWWGSSVARDLCRAYPHGGIPGCEGGPRQPTPPPLTAPAPIPPPPVDHTVGYQVSDYVSMSDDSLPLDDTTAVFVYSTVCPYTITVTLGGATGVTQATYPVSGAGQFSVTLLPGWPSINAGASISVSASPDFLCSYQNPGQAKIELRVVTR